MDKKKRIHCVLLALGVSIACPNIVSSAEKFDWLADFAQLKHEMSTHYANLDYAIDQRRMNLKQLAEDTEARLKNCSNDVEARKIIDSFLKQFGDGHLKIDWSQPSEKAEAKQEAIEQETLSSRLGFKQGKLNPGIAFNLLNEFSEIQTKDSKYFPLGILTLASGKKIGVLRIDLFTTRQYPDLCDTAVAKLGIDQSKPCDDDCSDRIDCETANLLTAALERQIHAFPKIDALLVDITRNGGGNDWVEPAARVFSSKHLRAPKMGFIRHEHWEKQFASRLEIVERELSSHKYAPEQNKLLSDAAMIFRKALAESKVSTDRDKIWNGGRPAPSLVVDDLIFTTGTVPYLEPGELHNTPAGDKIFYPSSYTYHEGAYAGSLIILVDDGTASAAEYFVSILADNGAARTIGTPTLGAGSGYTNGGIKAVLKSSGGIVKMPDCVRLRADGSNEVKGFAPDKLIPWREHDSPYQRATRAFDGLSEMMLDAPDR